MNDRIDDCEHDEVLRMELADGSHDWQCSNCGAFFELVAHPLKTPEPVAV